jgi:tetratricopeptide (TPR) repeat protein
VEKAVAYARQAAAQALEELAPDEALRLFTQALELHAQQPAPHPADRCELLLGLGEAQRQAGEPAFRETLLEAGELARELGEADLLAEAAFRNGRGFGSSRYGIVDEERVATIEAALAAVGPDDERVRARLLSKLALERNWDGDLPGRIALIDEALALARRTGDERTLAAVLGDGCLATWAPWTLEGRAEWLAELVEIADRLGDPFVVARAAWLGAVVAIEGADRASLDRHIERACLIADELGQPALRWFATYQKAAVQVLDGDLEAAERLAGEAAEIGMESGQPDAFIVAGAQMLSVRFHQGRAAEVVPLVEQAAQQNPGISSFPASLAYFLGAADRAGESAALLAEAARDDFASVPEDQLWASTMLLWADTAVVTEELDACAVLYGRLEPFGDQIPWSGAVGYPPLANYLGMLARSLGRFGVAERHFERAVEIEQAMGTEVFLARTRVEWAESLLTDGGDAAVERARDLLDAALVTARERGCAGIERRVEALLSPAL